MRNLEGSYLFLGQFNQLKPDGYFENLSIAEAKSEGEKGGGGGV